MTHLIELETERKKVQDMLEELKQREKEEQKQREEEEQKDLAYRFSEIYEKHFGSKVFYHLFHNQIILVFIWDEKFKVFLLLIIWRNLIRNLLWFTVILKLLFYILNQLN